MSLEVAFCGKFRPSSPGSNPSEGSPASSLPTVPLSPSSALLGNRAVARTRPASRSTLPWGHFPSQGFAFLAVMRAVGPAGSNRCPSSSSSRSPTPPLPARRSLGARARDNPRLVLSPAVWSFLKPRVTPFFFQGGAPVQLLLIAGLSAARAPSSQNLLQSWDPGAQPSLARTRGLPWLAPYHGLWSLASALTPAPASSASGCLCF